MKNFLLAAAAICVLASPSLAARTVYLKEGGAIKAKSAWRTKGTVHVLVNRDTLTEFSASEIDLKRTFPRKHRVMRKQTPAPAVSPATSVPPAGSAAQQNSAPPGTGIRLPNLPQLSGKSPQSPAPKGEEGAIRKHKKEMAEKTGE